MKIGQFLALRPDLLPQAYCDELMRLLDRATPFPWAEAERLLRAELGDALDMEFASIDPVPVAAGSLAQVHLGSLLDGTKVAVKILRPGIADQIARDLRRARHLARLLDLSRMRLVIAPQEVVEEIGGWLSQEIDLAHELSNLNRLRELTRVSPIQRVPRPYPALSTPRVLTAGYMGGLRFSELLAGHTPGLDTRLRELDIDTAVLATNLLEATLVQIFEYKFFHADLHPGNLIALPDGVIGYIDFGLCDRLAETVRQRQLQYLTAIYERDVGAMFRALTRVLIPTDETDMEAFRADFFAVAMAYLARADDGTKAEPGERSPIAEWMVRVVQSARRHRLRIPPNILTMYRSLLTAETVARRLNEHANLRRVAEFFERLRLADALESLHPEQLKPMMYDLLTLCREAPRQLQQVLADAAEGRLAAMIETSESALTRRNRNRRTKFIVTAVLSVGLSVSLSRPGSLVMFGVSLAGPLATLLVLVYASLWWQWRRLR